MVDCAAIAVNPSIESLVGMKIFAVPSVLLTLLEKKTTHTLWHIQNSNVIHPCICSVFVTSAGGTEFIENLEIHSKSLDFTEATSEFFFLFYRCVIYSHKPAYKIP